MLLKDHFDIDRVDRSSKLIPLSSSMVQSSLEFSSLTPTHILTTDASNYGWEAVCGPLSVRGVWSEDHLGRHINFLELETIFLALKKFWQC